MFARLLRLVELDSDFAFELFVGQLRGQKGDVVPVVNALDSRLDLTLVHGLVNAWPDKLVDQKEVVSIV